MTEEIAEPGWYADPSDAHAMRYWNGASWTTETAPLIATKREHRAKTYPSIKVYHLLLGIGTVGVLAAIIGLGVLAAHHPKGAEQVVGWIIFIPILILLLAYWSRKDAAKAEARRNPPRLVSSATVAGMSIGPMCSRCGGTTFVPRRQTSTKVMFGLLSLAGRPHWVECVTCGQMYKRPN